MVFCGSKLKPVLTPTCALLVTGVEATGKNQAVTWGINQAIRDSSWNQALRLSGRKRPSRAISGCSFSNPNKRRMTRFIRRNWLLYWQQAKPIRAKLHQAALSAASDWPDWLTIQADLSASGIADLEQRLA
jgi:hypothetical protein